MLEPGRQVWAGTSVAVQAASAAEAGSEFAALRVPVPAAGLAGKVVEGHGAASTEFVGMTAADSGKKQMYWRVAANRSFAADTFAGSAAAKAAEDTVVAAVGSLDSGTWCSLVERVHTLVAALR